MFNTIELHYLIKELTYYDENIVSLIKYFYEFELEFMHKFKTFIFKSYINLYAYSYIGTSSTYDCYKITLFLYKTRVYKKNYILFRINIYYYATNNFFGNSALSGLSEVCQKFKYDLSFYDIVKAVILDHMHNGSNTQKINFGQITYKRILDILLEQNSIYATKSIKNIKNIK